ncbi:G-rich sequence factor 1 [Lepisosteus oculatus]|uniref:G-rich sequence factor 1 n=1 Tax=Lepisosteus oculatus TaxID=7918 RepID=UPI0037117765
MSTPCRSMFISVLLRRFNGRLYFSSKKILQHSNVPITFCPTASTSGRLPRHQCVSTYAHLFQAPNNLGKLPVQRCLSSQIGVPFQEDEYPPLPDYNAKPEAEAKEIFIVRAKGLPWTCTADDVQRFFSECRIRDGVNGIHLTTKRDGRPSGEAFIELEDEEDVQKALEKHRQFMGSRYIEVFEVTNNDAEDILRQSADSPVKDGIVKLRGLPYTCTENDIIHFFSGLDIIQNGVTLVKDFRGRSTGDAYVEFASQEMADQALQRDREIIGNRYIEVFPSQKSAIRAKYDSQKKRGDFQPSFLEPGSSHTARRTVENVTDVPPQHRRSICAPEWESENDPSANLCAYHIHIRGLPFQVTGQDVAEFFSPLKLVKIQIEYSGDGRATGEADVYFATHEEAVMAMSRDRMLIQHRYVELFLNSGKNKEEVKTGASDDTL